VDWLIPESGDQSLEISESGLEVETKVWEIPESRDQSLEISWDTGLSQTSLAGNLRHGLSQASLAEI
jgi:hypothetical protein